MGYKVGVGISNKHLHLSEADLETLFGQGARLTPFKALVQPGQFAADERVDIIGPKGAFKGIRIIGPVRARTQVEISLTDARALGIDPPVRESGKTEGTPGVKLVGPAGEIDIAEGVIVALRHIHLSPAEAAEAGLKDKDLVDVQTFGTRPLIFQDVLIRSGDAHLREFHVDTDEANAGGLANGQEVEIVSGAK
ncbi:MAG: phosphate propanoyltransferase [Clostridiales Family XIII bacterium]|jgi:putative phosphotransacetylase|nr:phosphate propanoyltransferase [Clostridiales Family XIII bacterium]